jgi:hypothetical protein
LQLPTLNKSEAPTHVPLVLHGEVTSVLQVTHKTHAGQRTMPLSHLAQATLKHHITALVSKLVAQMLQPVETTKVPFGHNTSLATTNSVLSTLLTTHQHLLMSASTKQDSDGPFLPLTILSHSVKQI